MPYDDASAEIFVLNFGLYKVSIVGLMSSSFSCKKTSSCAHTHILAFLVLISSAWWLSNLCNFTRKLAKLVHYSYKPT